MLRPTYKLTIGDRIVDTTDEPQASTVTDLRLELDIDTPADRALLTLGQVDGLNPAMDDDAVVELGYADNSGLTQIFTGMVTHVEPGLITNHITAHSPAATLLRTYVDQTYENKTAGDIVSDLADQAGVDVSTTEPGTTFPAYVIDGRRNVDTHMRELASLCGFDLYFNDAGELVFQRFTNGNTVHGFDYAKHIIELDVPQSTPAATSVEAWGESPGNGTDESWAWLTKDFSGAKGSSGGSAGGSTGSGGPTLLLERPALRTADAAQTAADATQTAINRRTLRGRLLSVGRPEVKLGDAIRLSDVPDTELNATYQVRAITHRIIKATGFTTTIDFRSMA